MTDTNERAARMADLTHGLHDPHRRWTRVATDNLRWLFAEIERLDTERAAVAAAARRGDWGEVVRLVGWEDK